MQVECVVCGKKFVTSYKKSVTCSAECRKIYNRMYLFTSNRLNLNVRDSGKKYTNSNEKILAIKEKYKNGVPKGLIEDWLEIKKSKKKRSRF